MKRLALLTVLVLVAVAPGAFAQEYNHGEIGVFAELFQLHPANNVNFIGVGARADFNARKWLAFEAEMSYDFERSFDNVFTSPTTATFTRSNLSLLHGLFGPKIQTGAGAVRAFATAKGGFINFRGGACPATAGCFVNQVGLVPSGDTNGAVYFGGGIEAFAGAIGIRVDVGDEVYFDNGGNNNLKVTGGPVIRF